MHGSCQDFEKREAERLQQGRRAKPIEETLREMHREAPCPPASITRRLDGGIEDLGQLHAKLDEVLIRLRGPELMDNTRQVIRERDPGLEGEVDMLRNSVTCLNNKADEILERI